MLLKLGQQKKPLGVQRGGKPRRLGQAGQGARQLNTIEWRKTAIKTRDQQIDSIAQDNPSAAINQGDRIAEPVEQLAQAPEIGRPGRRRDTRELVLGGTPFIASYRGKGKSIEILRILHGAQQGPFLNKRAPSWRVE